MQGDDGHLLVTRRACFTPRKSKAEDWLRSNIFQTTCTMGGKVCRLVIDSGSCENMVSEEAIQKLRLATEKHPNPYKLSWLKRGNEVTVSKRCLVSFSIGLKYKDNAWCDVVVMDACHLLLGRPWQNNRENISNKLLFKNTHHINNLSIKSIYRNRISPTPFRKRNNKSTST